MHSGLLSSGRRRRQSAWIAIAVPAALLIVACFTASPPTLLNPLRRPTIVFASVVPAPDGILSQIPAGGFSVPVELGGPDQPFLFDVFIDFDPIVHTAPKIYPQEFLPTASTADGGVVVVTFDLDPASPDLDPAYCHRIEFLVAHGFNTNPPSPHTPDSIGGDSVSWLYSGAGGGNGCPLYDASALGDAGWLTDAAATDGLPVAPESGGGEP
jgi:hypothetical protein